MDWDAIFGQEFIRGEPGALTMRALSRGTPAQWEQLAPLECCCQRAWTSWSHACRCALLVHSAVSVRGFSTCVVSVVHHHSPFAQSRSALLHNHDTTTPTRVVIPFIRPHVSRIPRVSSVTFISFPLSALICFPLLMMVSITITIILDFHVYR